MMRARILLAAGAGLALAACQTAPADPVVELSTAAGEAAPLDVAAPVITLALLQRLRSRDPDSFSDRLLAALRNQFGGHEIKKE